MKTSELRLGNYVGLDLDGEYLSDNGDIKNAAYEVNDQYFIVDDISENELYLIDQSNECFEWEANQISPLLITENWLLRFGFSMRDAFTGYKLVTEKYKLYYDNGELTFADFDMGRALKFKGCKYIHQLQNLFFAMVDSELQLLKADA